MIMLRVPVKQGPTRLLELKDTPSSLIKFKVVGNPRSRTETARHIDSIWGA